MKRQHFLVCLILLFCECGYAQDQTNFTHFYLNPYLINPSYAGIDGRASLMLLYRKQWSTIKDGPQIGNVTFHAPISRRISFGISATDDQKGLLHSSGGMLSFAYNVPLSPQSFFRFGMSGGIASNSVDLQKLELSDPALANLLDNNMSVLGNAGVSVHLHTFHAGFSLPVIFAPSYVSKDAFTITEIDPFQSIIFHFSNRFYFNNDRNVFEPYAMYRMIDGLPPQFEVAGILHMNHAVWIGGSFKEDFGISALGGIKLKNSLAIGAAYTLKNSGINELNSPTYEVSLGILFGKRRDQTPLYSFVHTEKEKIKRKGKSSSEQIAEKRKQDEIARKKAMDEAAKKKQQEEIAKKQELINAQRAQEQEKKKLEDELKRQQMLAEQQARQNQASQNQLAQNNADALKKQQEDAARRQQEETLRKQQEDAARRQQEELARKQQEDLARKQQEDAARKLQEETARKQQAETARRQQEETARRQQEENQRREAELAERKRQEEELARAQRGQQTQPEQYTSTIRKDTVVVKHKPRFNHIDASMEVLNVEVTEHNEQDEKERIARLAAHADDPDQHHEGGDHPNSERHEFVKKGGHEDELDVADYVVTGVFKLESNARHFTDGLKKLGFKAKYGHLTEKAVWYVYLHQGTDINEARTERDRYRKMKIFRDAWLLTVHH
jgi:type IX secretion system PorP/SprF family membrane protein